MMYKMSTHASQDRLECMIYIMTEVGLGNKEVCTRQCAPNRREVLTDSGVLLVLSNDDILITAYVPSIAEAIRVWRNCAGHTREMPDGLNRRILSNNKHYKYLQKMNKNLGYHSK